MQNDEWQKDGQVVYAVGNFLFPDLDGPLTHEEITKLAEEAFFVKKQKSPAQLFATEP